MGIMAMLMKPAAAVAAGYDAAILAEPSLLHFYKLNEAAGATQALDSGGTLNSDAVSGVTFGAAALLSDGETTLSVPGTTADVHFASPLVDVAAAFSLECWVYFSALTLTRFLCVGTPFGNGCYLQVNDSGGLAFSFVLSGSLTSFSYTSALSAATAYHVVATRDGAGATSLYVNGVGTSGSFPGTIAAGTVSSLGGRPDGSSPLSGRIAKVAAYNAALTSTRVAAHYAAR